MDYFVFIFKSSLKDFLRNKIRTFLTSLGILIGILSVILLIAIGVGLQNYIKQQFDELGANSVYIMPGKVFNDQGGFRSTYTDEVMGLSFDEKDFYNLQRIKEIKMVAPVQTSGGTVQYGKEEEFASVLYSSEDVFSTLNLNVSQGRTFTKEDVNKRAKVIVIGHKIAKELFSSESFAVGKKVKMNNFSFSVIGVLEKKGGGGLGGPEFDGMVVIPYKTGFLISGTKDIAYFVLQPRNEELISLVKTKIEKEFLRRYEKDEFSIAEQTDILNTVTSIFSMINTALIAIAAISLLVGGIGIMNIMYVTVTERIKEIGIRRAIGARKIDILSQFLMESVLLSVFGGMLALMLAYVIVHFLKPYFPAEITVEAIMLALGVSSGIGILFGVLPAKKAADLSPIDAIRYE